MSESTGDSVSRRRTGKFRSQRRLACTVESSREGGRERFGEMAIVLFIGGHSCGAVADDGISRHRRLVSMMAPSTCN